MKNIIRPILSGVSRRFASGKPTLAGRCNGLASSTH